jgi:tetratricopeptide (TPR) repeat protein
VPGCVTLVTSRRDLGELGPAARFAVDVFTPGEALQYLAAAVPQIPAGSDPGAAARIARRCGHLPLALALVAGHMRVKPGWSLTDHADWLDERHEDRRLDSGVELALEVSYRNLPGAERALLRVIAQHPGQDFDARAAAAMAGIELPAAEARMAELAADHLVQVAAPGRYALHDLVRAYAAGRSADEDRRADRRAAVTRLLDYYVGVAAAAMNLFDPVDAPRRPAVPEPPVPLPDLADPLAWLEAERPNLIAVVTYSVADGRPEPAIRMAAILFRYLLGRHHYDAQLVHGHAARAAKQAGDMIEYARAVANLATADVYLGRHDAAVRNLEQALRVLRRSGNPSDEARTLNNLGIAETRLGRYQQAADHHRESLDLYRVVGDRVGRARALVNLGNLDSRLGREGEAVAHYSEALELYLESGDRPGAAGALSNMGGAEVKQGRYDSAETHLLQAIEVFRELHGLNGEANVLDGLGSLATRRGDIERALDYHRQALAIFREIGDRDSEACAQNGLGEAFQAAGDPARARAAFADALAIAAEEDVDDREEQARAHAGLAEVHRALGALDEAREHYAAARELWVELGSPRADDMAARLLAAS